MKLNKILMTASLLLAGVSANAQQTVTEYVFHPHWFGQVQVGGQETLGEGSFGKLLSPNVQLAFGYKFNPYIGLRLAVNGWQSRGAFNWMYYQDINGNATEYIDTDYYKWYYISPTLDAVVDMTNLIGGYNPTRVVEVNLIGGIGLNVGWHNYGANKLNNMYHDQMVNAGNLPYPSYKALQLAWDGTVCRFVGRMGLGINFNVSDRCQVGLELTANTTNDTYNSKKGANTDWYFNGLVGFNWAFGPKYEKVTRVIEPVEPQIIEKVVEKIVEVPVEVEPERAPAKKVQQEVFRRDVFFLINKYNIRESEMNKVAQVAEYLNTHPNATVTVTGYADKGTGTQAINLRLSAQRANAVANCLQTKYGIAKSRIIVKSMGEEMYQPYPDPVQNRVAICIAE